MASNTAIGLGLIVVAIMFISSGYEWVAAGLIMMGLVLLVMGSGSKAQAPTPQPVAAVVKPRYSKDREQEEKMATVEDLKFRPSVPADGFLGMGSMKSKTAPSGCNVTPGTRTGALAIDMGPIRFKDDLRFQVQSASANTGPFMPVGKDSAGIKGGNLLAWHFRTVKPIYYQKTKMLDSSVDSLDKEIWDQPGWDIDM